MSPAKVAAKFASARTDVLVSSLLLLSAIVAFFVFAVGVSEIVAAADGTGTALGSLALGGGHWRHGIVTVYTAIFASLASSIHHARATSMSSTASSGPQPRSTRPRTCFSECSCLTSAVPIARAGLARTVVDPICPVFTGGIYAVGSLSVKAPNTGIRGAFEILGTIFLHRVGLSSWDVRLLRAPGDRATDRTPVQPLSDAPESDGDRGRSRIRSMPPTRRQMMMSLVEPQR